MTSGLLQLVAKGVEDLFIIDNPEITFFKIIYRRHTNFSRDEYNLAFQSQLDFGKEAKCIVQRWGDLLHRLFLVINLPSVDAIFKPLTIKQVYDMLDNYGIEWKLPTDRLSDDIFYPSDFENVEILINKKINKLNKLIKNFEHMINLLKTDLHYENFNNSSYNDYYDNLVCNLLNFDKYGSQYKLIQNTIKEKCKNRTLENYSTICNDIEKTICNYAIGSILSDPASYNNENISFMLKCNEMDNYQNKHLDSYKLYSIDKSVQNVRYNLIKNPKLQLKIYKSLTLDDAKFIFYKNNGEFMNLSTIPSNEIEFNDRFTNTFLLDREINEPNDLINMFSKLVNEEILTFHNNNRLLLRNDKFLGYFNNYHLWDNLDISKKLFTKKINKKLSKMHDLHKFCFLNYIPILTNRDIPRAINRYLKNINHEHKNEIVNKFEHAKDSIEKELEDILYNNNDFNTINKLNANFKSNDRSNDNKNLIMSAIFRLHKCIKYNGENLLPTEYIMKRYTDLLNDYFGYNDDSHNDDNHIKNDLFNIINLFFLPLNKFIDNTAYMNNDRNFDKRYQINFIDKEILSDSISSIWNIILNGFVKNFNKLYYNKLLCPDFYEEFIGAEAKRYLDEINDLYLSSDNYYKEFNKHTFKSIERYIENKIRILNEELHHFDNNKHLVDINIHIKSKNKFNSFSNILESIDQKLVNDIFFDETNPYYDHSKSRLTSLDIIKNTSIFNNFDTKQLYEYEGLINKNYNSFTNELDVYNFMKDMIIKKSSLNFLVDIDESNIFNLYNKITDILKEKYNKYQDEYKKIILLQEHLEYTSIRNCDDRAKFAWIKYIGHYIIDYMTIKINDQEIDCQTGEWLQFWHQVSKHITKERGYNKLIGNVPELYEFNENPKRGYQLKIPLKFWFCKFIGSAIPLVALNNSEIEIKVKLKNFNEVSYHEPFIQFNRKIEASGHILAEYIYVEADERNRLVSNKLEYLIEQVQNNGNLVFNKVSLDCQNKIRERLFVENPCKEIFWAIQNLNYINGSLKNCERIYYNYTLDPYCEKINPAKIMKIEFCGRDREKYKCAEFYDKVVPYSRHYSTPSEGINVYSFALRPELPTPSGSVNLSRLDEVVLDIILKEMTVQNMKCNNAVYRMPIYITSMNILRIFGGQAGLAFYK